MRIGRRIVVLLVVGTVLVAAWVWLNTANRYAVDGYLELAGLQAPVTVLRDVHGIPYIFAENSADLFRAQGFVTAQHRLFQMQAYRAIANGRLAEAIGEAGLDSDREMRVLGLRRNAQRHLDQLSDESRALLRWYAEGVNAYIESHRRDHPLELRVAGMRATPWSEHDMVTVLHFINFAQAANFRAELAMQALIDQLGPDEARSLLPHNVNPERDTNPWPVAGRAQALDLVAADLLLGDVAGAAMPQVGSNNWAISAQHSASGGAIVANDPHLDARMLPGLWHPVGLFAPDIAAIGASLPGLPGLLVGRSEHVAFGITNAYGDSQDLFIETIDPERDDHYLDGERSLPFGEREEVIRIRDKQAAGGFREERLVVRHTRRGPIITANPLGGDFRQLLSLRTAAAESPGTQLGLKAMLMAGDVAAFDAALQQIGLFYFNFVFADSAGDTAFRATGRVPIRASGHGMHPKLVTGDDDWIGYIPAQDMPGVLAPSRGWVATANHDTRPEGYPYHYSSYFSPPYRYQVIARHLQRLSNSTPADHQALMSNVHNEQAAQLVPHISAALRGDGAHADLADILENWDLQDRVDSPAPTIYQAIYQRLAERIFAAPLGEMPAREWLVDWYRWQSLFDTVVESGLVDLPGQGAAETLPALIRAAADDIRPRLEADFGPDPRDWLWGRAHTVTFVSPLREHGIGRTLLGGGTHAYAGSGETVHRARMRFGGDFDTVFFSSMRFVADLADSEKVLAVIPGGVSERHFTPHRKDQLAPWLRHELVPWWFDRDAVEAHAQHRQELLPAAAD